PACIRRPCGPSGAFLAACGWADRDQAEAALAARDTRLAQAAADGEVVVLWFEHDLYDQLQLLQALDALAGARAAPGRVRAVLPGTFLTAADAASAVAAPVTADQLALARRAWAAFRAPDPAALAALAASATAPLPDLAPALRRALEDLPGCRDGLARTERQVLEACASGARDFEALFAALTALEEAAFLGDTALELWLVRLREGPAPLLDAGLAPTEVGHAVLEGRADHAALNGVERWVGGVRLSGRAPAWRWDREAAALAG
ncbi:MAG TPA: hypothetical protein VK279_00440, partial [Solirubrobacteraceae bacterium]|nr:hypothetical protein [Solirubrobacteraceae bacterium]